MKNRLNSYHKKVEIIIVKGFTECFSILATFRFSIFVWYLLSLFSIGSGVYININLCSFLSTDILFIYIQCFYSVWLKNSEIWVSFSHRTQRKMVDFSDNAWIYISGWTVTLNTVSSRYMAVSCFTVLFIKLHFLSVVKTPTYHFSNSKWYNMWRQSASIKLPPWRDGKMFFQQFHTTSCFLWSFSAAASTISLKCADKSYFSLHIGMCRWALLCFFQSELLINWKSAVLWCRRWNVTEYIFSSCHIVRQRETWWFSL